MISFDLKAKVSIVGDYGVGKTSIVLRYVRGEFEREYKPTLGADFAVRKVQVNNDPKRVVTLAIWDLAGQDTFEDLRALYLAGSVTTLVCFDLCSDASFAHVPNWVAQVTKTCGRVPVVLVGTKADQEDKRQVGDAEARARAKELLGDDRHYFETSAKINRGVAEVFDYVVDRLILTQVLNPKA